MFKANPPQSCSKMTSCIAISQLPLPRSINIGLRAGLTSRLEPFTTVTQEAVQLFCNDEDCADCSVVVVTALSRVNTAESVGHAASSIAEIVAKNLKQGGFLSRNINRCFRIVKRRNKLTGETDNPTVIITSRNMKGGVGEQHVTAEKKGAVGGYMLNLVDWSKSKTRRKSKSQELPTPTMTEKASSSSAGNINGNITEDFTISSKTESTQQNMSATPEKSHSTTNIPDLIASDNTDPPLQQSKNVDATRDPEQSSTSRQQPSNSKKKGKSLSTSLLHRPSTSSGSDSDSESSSSSFDYGPPEFEPATSKEEEPIIPNPGVFNATRLVQIPVSQLITEGLIPTVAQCAAHLELLGCFSKLRANVETSDVVGEFIFGSEHKEPDDQDKIATSKDIKWRAFVSKAVERFHIWWIKFPEVVKQIEQTTVTANRVAQDGHARADERKFFKQWNKKKAPEDVAGFDLLAGLNEFQKEDFASGVQFRSLTADTLPPLDVILVWHAYTLNPHAFYQDCIRMDRLELWGTPLPWDLIHDAIDNYDFSYKLSDKAANFFTKITGMASDLYHDLHHINEVDPLKATGEPQKQTLSCPWCEKSFPVDLPEWYKAGDVGDYNGACVNCGKEYDKEAVAASTFLKDVHEFFLSEARKEKVIGSQETEEAQRIPNFMLRGGVLHPTSGHYIDQTHPLTKEQTYPSRALLSGVLLTAFPSLHAVAGDVGVSPDFPSLLNEFGSTSKIQSHLQNHTSLATNPDETMSPIPILRRIITNIVSTYKHLPLLTSSTPVPFSTDLTAAVLRQGTFIRKIHNDALLIRSPALAGTISRSRVRYDKFFRLIGKYRGTIFVPTNEIDLVWHTHQCFPQLYYIFSNLVTGAGGFGDGSSNSNITSSVPLWKYVDHNDRLGEGILGNGFEDTKRLWKVEYGNPERQNIPGKKASKSWAGIFHGAWSWRWGQRPSSPTDSSVIANEINGNQNGDTPVNPDIGLSIGDTNNGEDSEEWDNDGKYVICVCWNCELRKEMIEGKKKKRMLRRSSRERFTKKEEWTLRATVFYHRKVEETRRLGKPLLVWRNREPWA